MSNLRFLKEARVYDESNSLKMCKGNKKEQICVNNQNTNESACKGKIYSNQLTKSSIEILLLYNNLL